MESFGALSLSFSLNSINLFTYLDAYSTALTPLCGAEPVSYTHLTLPTTPYV